LMLLFIIDLAQIIDILEIFVLLTTYFYICQPN